MVVDDRTVSPLPGTATSIPVRRPRRDEDARRRAQAAFDDIIRRRYRPLAGR